MNHNSKGEIPIWHRISQNCMAALYSTTRVMRSKLPKDMYKALKKTIENGTHLELDVANSVAVAMKEWAIENGATHYTHWFQPMTERNSRKT